MRDKRAVEKLGLLAEGDEQVHFGALEALTCRRD
jgi:hypothetical protein